MQLSIVECSDYKHSNSWQSQKIPICKLTDSIEVIGPVKGPSAAVMRNCGAEVARGKWLFFKDHDCQVNIPRLLEMIEQFESKKKLSIVGGIYRNKKGNHLSKVYNIIQRRWVLGGVDKKKNQASHLLGGALLVPKKTFHSVGPFSEKIGWGSEETDWVKRAIEKGFESTQSYRIVVSHENSISVAGFLKRAWFQNFNSAYYNVENVSTTAIKKYFLGRALNWPAMLLFFSVATLGRGAGRAMKRGGF